LGSADAIYVNAGASKPLASWLDAIRTGGRLVFTLTDSHGHGCMLKITRAEAGPWPARMISGAAFIGLVGGGDEREGLAVHDAFHRGGAAEVRWLRRDARKSRQDWLRGQGWRLTC
jgi:protein-L-isoaspartate(D-aspartate) O-methyltransferase